MESWGVHVVVCTADDPGRRGGRPEVESTKIIGAGEGLLFIVIIVIARKCLVRANLRRVQQ
jgi:hypothetical protein